MRIPDIVLEALSKDEDLVCERQVYLLIWAYEPGSMAELARLAGTGRNQIGRACHKLAERGWVKLHAYGRRTIPAPCVPHQCQETMVEGLKLEYSMAQNKGEFLAKKRMELWIRDDTYMDNARPGFLLNPVTGEEMECDRIHWRVKLVGEFNGWQHYGPTRDYGDEKSREQQARDLMKMSLCEKNGFTIVEFTPDDLRPGALEAKLEEARPDLKRRHIDTEGPYFRALMELGSAYAAKAAKDKPRKVAPR